MSLGRAPAGGIGAPGPSPPTSRPLWLLILSSITLVQGGLTLVSGLSILRDPVDAAKLPALSRPLAPDEEAMTRELSAVGGVIITRYQGALRACGAASMVVALLMLYAAAAALSRDRYGRRAMLIAAWAGIAYRVGTLPVTIPFASEVADASAPIQIRFAATASPKPAGAADGAAASAGVASAPNLPATGDKSDPPLTAEAQASLNRTYLLGLSLVSALLGVLGSLLLIGYFGGRRGRALYGLAPRLG